MAELALSLESQAFFLEINWDSDCGISLYLYRISSFRSTTTLQDSRFVSLPYARGNEAFRPMRLRATAPGRRWSTLGFKAAVILLFVMGHETPDRPPVYSLDVMSILLAIISLYTLYISMQTGSALVHHDELRGSLWAFLYPTSVLHLCIPARWAVSPLTPGLHII